MLSHPGGRRLKPEERAVGAPESRSASRCHQLSAIHLPTPPTPRPRAESGLTAQMQPATRPSPSRSPDQPPGPTPRPPLPPTPQKIRKQGEPGAPIPPHLFQTGSQGRGPRHLLLMPWPLCRHLGPQSARSWLHSPPPLGLELSGPKLVRAHRTQALAVPSGGGRVRCEELSLHS